MALNLKRLGFGVAVIVVGLGASYLLREPQAEPPSYRVATAGAVAVAPPPVALRPDTSASSALQPKTGATSRSENPLELSHDLRAIYDRYKASGDPAERYTAYRAWSACFPTFVAPEGQLASLESLTQALPEKGPQRAIRADAYRNLQARCRSFADMPRKEILDAARSQQEANNRGTLISPGELAEKYLSQGNKEAALQTMRAIVAAGDPFAIGSLREFVNQLIVLQVDAQTTHSDQRPDLRSLAFTLAACQMGLECGAGSLTALQLCTSMGKCAGSVTDRYQEALPNQADRDALAIETRRVLGAIQAGNFEALGLN